MGLVDLVAPKETAAMMSDRLLVKYIKSVSTSSLEWAGTILSLCSVK